MNYHIIYQDKFFETYIEDIYRIHQEKNNVIWIRGNQVDSPFFHTNRPVEYLGEKAETFLEHFQSLTPEDKLFVSWYDSFIGRIILQAKLSVPVYVYLMGGEFYSQPMWWHEKWLFDPLTKFKIKNNRFYPVYIPVWKPWKWYRLITFYKHLHKQYSEKLETVKRIDYIVLPEHATGEMGLLYQLYPGCRAEHRYGVFDQNYDNAKGFPLKSIPKNGERLKILLGNSSDPSGNHFDAIRFLHNGNLDSNEVYSLLSYGDGDVRKWIIEYGQRLLGNSFHAITDYMNRREYIVFLNEMDIVMMYHNRQQAMGTIMIALALGKPVFLKTKSPIYKLLTSLGIDSVYDVFMMNSINLVDAIFQAQNNRNDTLERLSREFSTEVRLMHLKKLLE